MRCSILHDMDNMEASCVLYVQVGVFTHLEQNKVSFWNVNKTGIVRQTIQYELIVSIRFMWYPRDDLRQSSADHISLEQCSIYHWQQCHFGCHTTPVISANKQTTWDRLIVQRVALGSPCRLQLYAAGFVLNVRYMLATTYSIRPWG